MTPIHSSAMNRRTVAAWLSLAPFVATASAARAGGELPGSNWPLRTVKILVGYPAGTSTDALARLAAERLAQAVGQSVIVENRAGANGEIALQLLSDSDDDHLLAITPNAPLLTGPLLKPRLRYAVGKTIWPVSLLATNPFVLTVGGKGPDDAKALFAEAARGGPRWNYGSSGNGSAAHLGMEMIKRDVGWKMQHVPYRGNTDVVTALIGGEIQLALLPPSLVTPQLAGGRLHAVAMAGGRSVLMPGVPALREAGLASATDLEGFNAAVAGQAMTPAQRMRLASLLMPILQAHDVRQRLYAQGFQAVGSTPEALQQRMRRDAAVYAEVIKALNITAD